jgi:hypothetical protein
MILAGTRPRGGEGIDDITKVALVMYLKAALTLKDSRNYLFFPRTPEGKAGGQGLLRAAEGAQDGPRRAHLASGEARQQPLGGPGKTPGERTSPDLPRLGPRWCLPAPPRVRPRGAGLPQRLRD